jgi:chromosome segregation ATPase
MSRSLSYKNIAKLLKQNFQGLDTDLAAVESVINSLASTYVAIADIVDDLTTGGSSSVLSAEQGKQLKSDIDAINAILNSDDVNLDTVQEIIDYLKNVQAELGGILEDSLTSTSTTKALTANQGKVLKDALDVIDGNVSTLQSDVTQLQGDLSTAQADISTLQSDVSDLQESVKGKWVKKTSAATLTLNERNVYGVISSAATLTLPSVGAGDDGIEFVVLNRDDSTANLTLSGNGKNIDSAGTFVLGAGEYVKVIYDHSATKFFTVY